MALFAWLVLEWCERKTLLAGWCWRLLLEWYERKILLAGWRPLEQNMIYVCCYLFSYIVTFCIS